MRYAIALDQGGWVVRDGITGRSVTRPATSEEAQQAVAEWNARCVTRKVDPPVKVDGWVPAGELRAWLRAEDGWWGLVSGRDGLRWIGYVPKICAGPSLDCTTWCHSGSLQQLGCLLSSVILTEERVP